MIEPSKLKSAASNFEDENQTFRRFLKIHADPDELDQHFSNLHHEIFSGYDCVNCRNCCRVYKISLGEDEISQIAAFLNMTTEAFTEKHLVQSVTGYEVKAPCGFLEADGKCRIQDCKPAECMGYPYTDQPDRVHSLFGVMSFAEVCPVVFEIVQRLKIIYRFI